MILLILIIFFVILINELIIKGNIDSIVKYVKNFILDSDKLVKQETPTYFINYINYNFRKIINYDDSYLLLDFGSGDGTSLQKLKICEKKIGIEIDKSIYNLAVKNNKYTNIEFINDDISNYKFNENTIIFMYEPLWLCTDYISTYNKLFENIVNSNNHIYIIYVTGLTKQLEEKHFDKFNFKLKHKHKYGSILLYRYVYIYSNI